ncbi:MAG: hypothetical protein V7707_10790 [Motiliproteus sp.]
MKSHAFESVTNELKITPIAIISPVDHQLYQRYKANIVTDGAQVKTLTRSIENTAKLIARFLNDLNVQVWRAKDLLIEQHSIIQNSNDGVSSYPAYVVSYSGQDIGADLEIQMKESIRRLASCIIARGLFNTELIDSPSQLPAEIEAIVDTYRGQVLAKNDNKNIVAPFQIDLGESVIELAGAYDHLVSSAPDVQIPIVGICRVDGLFVSENSLFIIPFNSDIKKRLAVTYEPTLFFQTIAEAITRQVLMEFTIAPIKNTAKDRIKYRLDSLKSIDSSIRLEYELAQENTVTED